MFIATHRAPAVSTTPISPSASCAPNAPARRCDNASPCQSGTTLRDRPTRLAGAVPAHRDEQVLAGQMPLPGDTPPALESHAQHIAAPLLARERVGTVWSPRLTAATSNTVDVDSLELLRPRSKSAWNGPRGVGDGPTRPAHAARGARYRCVVARRRHRLDHRAHGTPGLRARHPALAGRTQRLGRTARRALRNAGTDAAVSRLRCADGAQARPSNTICSTRRWGCSTCIRRSRFMT